MKENRVNVLGHRVSLTSLGGCEPCPKDQQRGRGRLTPRAHSNAGAGGVPCSKLPQREISGIWL